MGRKKQHLKEDKYYFEVGNITIYRDSEEMARKAFNQYERIGKDANYLGLWDGENFVSEN